MTEIHTRHEFNKNRLRHIDKLTKKWEDKNSRGRKLVEKEKNGMEWDLMTSQTDSTSRKSLDNRTKGESWRVVWVRRQTQSTLEAKERKEGARANKEDSMNAEKMNEWA